MIGEELVSNVITGLIRTHKLDKYAKLLFSVGLSAFMTFLASFGTGGIAHLASGQSPFLALAYGLCEGCLTTASLTFFLLQKSDLTKGMTFSVPTSVEIKQHEILVKEGISSFEKK